MREALAWPRDEAVGHQARHPHRAFVAVALADHLEQPHLVRVGDGEGLARAGVAVLRHQVGHHRDGLAGRLRPLQPEPHQAAVVDDGLRVVQLFTPPEGALGDDELVLVHVADDRVRLFGLVDLPEELAGVPLEDVVLRARRELRRGVAVELAVQLVRVGRVGDHRRAVGARALRDEEVGAGACGLRPGDEQHGESGGGGEETHGAQLYTRRRASAPPFTVATSAWRSTRRGTARWPAPSARRAR